METDENNETVKISTLGVVMEWVLASCPFIIAVMEFASGNFVSGFGWCLAGVGWIAAATARKWVETFIGLYREHLEECEKRDKAYKAKIQEYEDKLSNEKNTTKLEAFDVEHMSIDDVLKIGRDFQMSDTWRGATHDTAKLLCDTIEMLQNKLNKRGNRNCDVYGTVESALAACHEDRGYCKSPIDERKSTVQFMLQDVKDNSFNKNSDVKKDGE